MARAVNDVTVGATAKDFKEWRLCNNAISGLGCVPLRSVGF